MMSEKFNPAVRNRRSETMVYIVLWSIMIGLYLLGTMRQNAQLSGNLLELSVLTGMFRTIVPLLVLFLINNNILIPRLLLRNRWGAYVAVLVVVLALLWCWQYYDFMRVDRIVHPEPHPGPHPGYRPLVPMPVILDFTYALLVVGTNLAIALLFQSYADKFERERLMKSNAETQLTLLKAQINPHFYLNMLNNIHGMIEIDAERAQAMLIDMSRLMRFMLYDSSRPLITLREEVEFLENYLQLMRQRYPSERVSVSWSFPSDAASRGVTLPPLLFLSFIENAFKHGVSYREPSYIVVSMEVQDNRLCFSCENSVAERRAPTEPEGHSGIGLKNIRERLRLLYDERMSLTISDEDNKYSVHLIIPLHGTTKDSDN